MEHNFLNIDTTTIGSKLTFVGWAIVTLKTIVTSVEFPSNQSLSDAFILGFVGATGALVLAIFIALAKKLWIGRKTWFHKLIEKIKKKKSNV